MKRPSHYSIASVFMFSCLVALLYSSCKNPFDKNDNTAVKYGSLTVSAQRTDGARTLRPTADSLQIATYDFHLIGPGSITVDETSTSGTATISDLIIGDWTVTITAKNASGVVLLASNAVAFTVTENQTSAVTVPMLAATGTGTVAVSLDLTAAAGLVSSFTGTIKDLVNGGDTISIDGKITYESGIAVYSDTLTAGTYRLIITMLNSQGNVVGMIIEAMDVFAGIATGPTITVKAAYLNQPPTAPTGLAVAGATAATLNISWNTVIGATSYQLYRDTDSNGIFTTCVFSGAALSYTDTGLSNDTAYYYKVGATNPFGVGALSSAISGATLINNSLITIYAAGDSFVMGDGTNGPNVEQLISYNYMISKYETTNGEFAQFIADSGYTTQSYWTTAGWSWKGSITEPAHWNDATYNRSNQPVQGIGWREAIAYCNWRSIEESLTPAYNANGMADLSANGYRLPTEVEWEYAAAKGAPSLPERIYAWGNSWDSSLCVSQENYTEPQDVGSKSPGGDTPQGLTDMIGNAWELCGDNWEGTVASGIDRYHFASDVSGQYMVFRGGSWMHDASAGLAARREIGDINGRDDRAGFRVVRRADTPVPSAPSGLTAVIESSTKVRLAWTDASSTEAGFKIERSLDGFSGWTQVGTSAKNTATYIDTGLTADTTYFYRVKAWNGGGASAASNTASATPSSAQYWAKSFGGTSDDLGMWALQGSDDSYYLGGHTTSSGSENYDGWVIKTGESGNILWQKAFNGSLGDFCSLGIQTNDGNLIIGALTQSYGAGAADIWIMKINTDGKILWQKAYGGGGDEALMKILKTSDGGYALSGHTQSWGLGGGWYSTDALVMKIDSGGDLQWVKAYGIGAGSEEFLDIIQTSDGGFLCTGKYNFGGQDPMECSEWVVRLDNTGNVLWQKALDFYQSMDYGCRAIECPDGDYIIAGNEDQDFSLPRDFWLIKMDKDDGTILWQKAFGGNGSDCLWGVIKLSSSVLLYGFTNSFGIVEHDAWLIMTDFSGTIQWQKRYGGSGVDWIYSQDAVTQANDGGFIINGSSHGYTAGAWDWWVIKTLPDGSCPPLSTDTDAVAVNTNCTEMTTACTVTTITDCVTTSTNFAVIDTNCATSQQAPVKASAITLSGSLLQDYAVTFTVTSAQTIAAPDTLGSYPMFTIPQAALPLTVSVTSMPTANTFQWLLNGSELASTTASIELNSLAIQQHYLTLMLKKDGDPFRSATIILKATD